MMQASPWLGAGPAHFAHYGRDLPHGTAHPHSWLLQIGSEWGLPALLLLCGAVALAMHKLWQLRTTTIELKDQTTLAAWLVTGWAILVDGLVSGLIVFPTSQLWIALYLGCAWGWVVTRSSSSKPAVFRPPVLSRIVIPVVAPLMLHVLLQGMLPDVQGMSLRKQLEAKNTLHWPRIWSEGRF
jgi:hypothetical protein